MSKTKNKAQQWEYKIEIIGYYSMESVLAEFGKVGWKVIKLFKNHGMTLDEATFTVILERELL